MNSRCHPLAEIECEPKGVTANCENASSLNCSDGADDVALEVLINQIEFVRVLSVARDATDLGERMLEVLESLGFSDYAVIRHSPCRAFDVKLSSLSQELIEIYQAEMFYIHDMVLDYLKTDNPEPMFHSAIAGIIESASLMTLAFERNREILGLYKQFEFNDTYFIPVRTNRGAGEDRLLFSIMARGISPDAFRVRIEKCRPILRLLADAVSFILDTKFSNHKHKHVPSARPMRLLTVMAKQDLTLSQAASKLCISIDTANKHMALAKKALGTRSQANAVYLALKQGLIDFS